MAGNSSEEKSSDVVAQARLGRWSRDLGILGTAFGVLSTFVLLLVPSTKGKIVALSAIVCISLAFLAGLYARRKIHQVAIVVIGAGIAMILLGYLSISLGTGGNSKGQASASSDPGTWTGPLVLPVGAGENLDNDLFQGGHRDGVASVSETGADVSARSAPGSNTLLKALRSARVAVTQMASVEACDDDIGWVQEIAFERGRQVCVLTNEGNRFVLEMLSADSEALVFKMLLAPA